MKARRLLNRRGAEKNLASFRRTANVTASLEKKEQNRNAFSDFVCLGLHKKAFRVSLAFISRGRFYFDVLVTEAAHHPHEVTLTGFFGMCHPAGKCIHPH